MTTYPQGDIESEGRASKDPETGLPPDLVWSYRGYKLKSSEFTTAMVHFFRAEIQRANVWRQRLDATTNWAVISTGAALTYAFSQGTGHHGVIILTTLLITLFLYIEARRYRYYELWSYRVRLMETDFFAAMLVPPFHPDPDWAESLAESLLHPDFPISMLEAFGRRMRRNYMWIFIILGMAWVARIGLFPSPVFSVEHFLIRASFGPIPGEVMLAVGLGFNGLLFLVGLLTVGLHSASGEVLPRYGDLLAALTNGARGVKPSGWQAWFRPSRKRKQLMALIITDQADVVSKCILEEMSRGVTSIPGTGMYTGKAHSVLLIALTVTEVGQLKSLVVKQDPKAFVIVSPVQELLGGGFAPLGEKET